MKHKRAVIRTITLRSRRVRRSRGPYHIFPASKRRHSKPVRRMRHNHKNPSVTIRRIVAPSLVGRYVLVVKLKRFMSHEDQERVEQACKSLGSNMCKLVYKTGMDYGRSDPHYKHYRQIRLVSEDSLMVLRLCIPDLIWRVMRVVAA